MRVGTCLGPATVDGEGTGGDKGFGSQISYSKSDCDMKISSCDGERAHTPIGESISSSSATEMFTYQAGHLAQTESEYR